MKTVALFASIVAVAVTASLCLWVALYSYSTIGAVQLHTKSIAGELSSINKQRSPAADWFYFDLAPYAWSIDQNIILRPKLYGRQSYKLTILTGGNPAISSGNEWINPDHSWNTLIPNGHYFRAQDVLLLLQTQGGGIRVPTIEVKPTGINAVRGMIKSGVSALRLTQSTINSKNTRPKANSPYIAFLATIAFFCTVIQMLLYRRKARSS